MSYSNSGNIVSAFGLILLYSLVPYSPSLFFTLLSKNEYKLGAQKEINVWLPVIIAHIRQISIVAVLQIKPKQAL